MKIVIKGTSEVKHLSIIDPRTGFDYISDFIGNSGALFDGQFELDEDLDAYRCDQETFDWWDKVVNDNQKLAYRLHRLCKEYGTDKVWDVIQSSGSGNLEDHAASVNQVLDEAFGEVAIS